MLGYDAKKIEQLKLEKNKYIIKGGSVYFWLLFYYTLCNQFKPGDDEIVGYTYAINYSVYHYLATPQERSDAKTDYLRCKGVFL